ncbi:hypothetical protein Cgig2_027314 [Carnegiea gigantea]|uniref:Uncharacterized protein n=1 Tax=Carnegiea gigantea TaxID=171969 RepID=A0A9Q1GRQ8_9CARY|nr:hypothetical protein Cgig2_027314 [Carnegiea gigantea]
MSFSPVMVASGSQPNRKDYNVASDLEEDMGDSDEANEDVSNELRKVNFLLQVFILALESIEVKVLTKLREYPGVATKAVKALDFLFNVMEYIKREKDAYYFITFDNDDVCRYLKVIGFGDFTTSSKSTPKITRDDRWGKWGVFLKGASYRDVEIRFLNSPSTISKYHNQVLQALVKLSIDNVRPYQSQHQVPPEIAEKSRFF